MRAFVLRGWFALLSALLVVSSAANAAGRVDAGRTDAGWTEQVLYSFSGLHDGAFPTAGLVADASGALYGTTPGGRGMGLGTVFRLVPPAPGTIGWQYQLLHAFTAGVDGRYPTANLLLYGGAIYGTTAAGGLRQGGAIFKLTPPATAGAAWPESILTSFPLRGRGNLRFSEPQGLVVDASGNFYGSTLYGGPVPLDDPCDPYYGVLTCGSIFKVTPPVAGQTMWPITILYTFSIDDTDYAAYPSVVTEVGGALFGTTLEGGTDYCSRDPHGSCGTVFELAPSATSSTWTFTIVHGFEGLGVYPNDGFYPTAGVVAGANGTLYGTTSVGGGTCVRASCREVCRFNGCGSVFALSPPPAGQVAWTQRILHRFSGNGDGLTPLSGVAFDAAGALYGTTSAGSGTACSCGTVYRVRGAGFATLYRFTGPDGAVPLGAPLIIGQNVYGTTSSGGATNHGAVYALSPTSTARRQR